MSKNSGPTIEARSLIAERRREGDFAERIGRDLKSAADLLARFGRATSSAALQPAPATDHVWDIDGLAARIASNAGQFLAGQSLDPNADFFELGGTSVNAVELVALLSRELGIQLSLDDLFADARPRRLAERWLAKAGSPLRAASSQRATPATAATGLARTPVTRPLPSIDRPENLDDDLQKLNADLNLADALPWVAAPAMQTPRRILLTGATGFLGSQMLFDLLRHSDAHVFCLVRAKDEALAVEKLAQGLRLRDMPWSTELQRRITVVVGDIREPLLGLTQERWEALAHEVDSVVNVAASVDFLRGYHSMRRSNVLGPLTLATFATTGRIKPLHQISTISVFDELGIRTLGEDDPPAHIDKLFAGYEKTKWAAEAILRRARERGLLVSIYRPGGIGGHTVTGVYNPLDLSSGFMSAWQLLRAMPEFRYMHIAPVDWVSRTISELVLDETSWGYNYHVTGSPLNLGQVARDMSLGGMNISILSFEEWRQRFLDRMEADPVPHLEYLTRVLASPSALKLIEATLTAPAASAERTEAFIRRRKLPRAVPFNARAMLAMSERLARDGHGKLPGRDDAPYLQFDETMKGVLGPIGAPAETRFTSRLKLSVASFYQLLQERRIDIHGEMSCPLLHPEPLQVESGDLWVRPNDGVPERHGHAHPLLRYTLALRAADGQKWWLEGLKTARPGRDWWQQARTLRIEVGRHGEPASLAGELVVPPETYMNDQIDGIEVNSTTPLPQRGVAKLIWLAWFGAQFGLGFSEPLLRTFVDLLDARRGFAQPQVRRV